MIPYWAQASLGLTAIQVVGQEKGGEDLSWALACYDAAINTS